LKLKLIRFEQIWEKFEQSLGKKQEKFGQIWAKSAQNWLRFAQIWLDLGKIKILHPKKHSISNGYYENYTEWAKVGTHSIIWSYPKIVLSHLRFSCKHFCKQSFD